MATSDRKVQVETATAALQEFKQALDDLDDPDDPEMNEEQNELLGAGETIIMAGVEWQVFYDYADGWDAIQQDTDQNVTLPADRSPSVLISEIAVISDWTTTGLADRG